MVVLNEESSQTMCMDALKEIVLITKETFAELELVTAKIETLVVDTRLIGISFQNDLDTIMVKLNGKLQGHPELDDILEVVNSIRKALE